MLLSVKICGIISENLREINNGLLYFGIGILAFQGLNFCDRCLSGAEALSSYFVMIFGQKSSQNEEYGVSWICYNNVTPCGVLALHILILNHHYPLTFNLFLASVLRISA